MAGDFEAVDEQGHDMVVSPELIQQVMSGIFAGQPPHEVISTIMDQLPEDEAAALRATLRRLLPANVVMDAEEIDGEAGEVAPAPPRRRAAQQPQQPPRRGAPAQGRRPQRRMPEPEPEEEEIDPEEEMLETLNQFGAQIGAVLHDISGVEIGVTLTARQVKAAAFYLDENDEPVYLSRRKGVISRLGDVLGIVAAEAVDAFSATNDDDYEDIDDDDDDGIDNDDDQ